MEVDHLVKAREHAKKGKTHLKQKEYEKALKEFEFSMQYYLEVLPGDLDPDIATAVIDESHEILSRAESLKEYLHKGNDEHKAGTASSVKSKGEGSEGSDEYKKRLESTLVTQKSDLKWSDVIGLDEAKNILNDALILPTLFGDAVAVFSPCNAVLLYGPPGTGKTHLAKAAAAETNTKFFAVSVSDISSKYHGETQLMINVLFELAREHQPSIIFIDEVDSLCSNREGRNQSEHDNQVKAELLLQMNMDGKYNNTGLFFLAATNLPQNIDPAFRRRWQKLVYVPLPNSDARKEIFKCQLKKVSHNLKEADLDQLASYERLSGSDIKSIVKDAVMEPYRRTQQSKFFKPSGTKFIACSSADQGAVPSTYADYPRGSFEFDPISMVSYIVNVKQLFVY